LHLLSSDHTLANEMLQVGGMTSEEANASRYAHILTRSIGQQESVQVESLLFDLFPGDVCLLCSDGLSRYMESPDQVARLLREKRLDSVPKRLIEFANYWEAQITSPLLFWKWKLVQVRSVRTRKSYNTACK
jgi:serine/threonine protein phosphatase PrpC